MRGVEERVSVQEGGVGLEGGVVSRGGGRERESELVLVGLLGLVEGVYGSLLILC